MGMRARIIARVSVSASVLLLACGSERAAPRAAGAMQGEAGVRGTATAGAQPAQQAAGRGGRAASDMPPPRAGRSAAPVAAGAGSSAPADPAPRPDAGPTKPSGPGASDAGASTAPGALSVESEVWKDGEQLDAMYRCPGPSPALRFSGAPAGTLAHAVVIIDRSNSFVHWVIYDIPADVQELPEGIREAAVLDQPAGAKQAAAYDGTRGYVGPCGRNNNPYELTLYALDVAALPGIAMSSSPREVIEAIETHAIESVAITAMSGPGR